MSGKSTRTTDSDVQHRYVDFSSDELTEIRENADQDGRDALKDLWKIERRARFEHETLTKIHDQPSSPEIPSMKEIAYARRPENAPIQDCADEHEH